MLKTIQRISNVANMYVLDGVRRYTLVGLLAISLLMVLFGFFFIDFFGRDIGRVSSDFLFSILWFSGLIYIFFHVIQTIVWDSESKLIYVILARPISRSEYVLGVYAGLALLLFCLEFILGLSAWFTLIWIQQSLKVEYFEVLNLPHFILTWCGLFCLQLMLLAAVMLFSSFMRGGFLVLLLGLSYYLICSGLPIVLESVSHQFSLSGDGAMLMKILQCSGAVFPDFSQLDFKNLVLTNELHLSVQEIFIRFMVVVFYTALLLFLACFFYSRRDLV